MERPLSPSTLVSAALPTQVLVPSIDLSAFVRCIQTLEARIGQLEATTIVLQKENKRLTDMNTEMSHQTLVSQDQYASLYETVHAGLTQVTILQNASYAKTQAVEDFAKVHHQIDLLKEETARLETAKIDAASNVLETRVEHTSTECTSKMLAKFEKESREWTIYQLGIAEERITKLTATKLGESDAKVDQKLLSMQGSVDEVTFKEAMMRKDVDAQATASTNALRNFAGKLETHEKHLDIAEENLYSQIDVVRRKFEVFLEHCFGISWPSILNGIAMTSTLLRLDARKSLSEAPSELTFRRGGTKLRRLMENLRDWRRLQSVNARIVLGMGDITKKLENSDEQLELTTQQRLQLRRTEDAALEQQHRNELEAQFQLLAEYMALLSNPDRKEVDAGVLAHPAVQALRHMLGAPLFAHIRASLSTEVRQSMSLSKEEFGQEYSNQLALVNKELRGKATLSGLEDTIREFASRTLKVQLEGIEKNVKTVLDTYVTEATLMELMSSKADGLILERKANDADVQAALDKVREDMEALNLRTHTELQLQMIERIADLSRELPAAAKRSDSKKHGMSDSHSQGASANVQSLTGSKLGNRCLSCNQEVSPAAATGSAEGGQGQVMRGNATRASSNVKQQQADDDNNDYIQISTGLHHHRSPSHDDEFSANLNSAVESSSVDGVNAVGEAVQTSGGHGGGVDPRPNTSAPFRMREWADGVDKKFGIKERKTPRPPSASTNTSSLSMKRTQ
ncbi:Hypothetical protein, putative [Bodo saltans]|uniref:Uncharacterized protein n=1 Tax=Bodo saltans TaxID=75058 RepID=A0A0S4J5P6_BODSA|nr:Hypothetical protein, putative [Bodo saltans]|eukprot:CUG84241.1 Hypothetical protein, putative [Bodo saltans]